MSNIIRGVEDNERYIAAAPDKTHAAGLQNIAVYHVVLADAEHDIHRRGVPLPLRILRVLGFGSGQADLRQEVLAEGHAVGADIEIGIVRGTGAAVQSIGLHLIIPFISVGQQNQTIRGPGR